MWAVTWYQRLPPYFQPGEPGERNTGTLFLLLPPHLFSFQELFIDEQYWEEIYPHMRVYWHKRGPLETHPEGWQPAPKWFGRLTIPHHPYPVPTHHQTWLQADLCECSTIDCPFICRTTSGTLCLCLAMYVFSSFVVFVSLPPPTAGAPG